MGFDYCGLFFYVLFRAFITIIAIFFGSLIIAEALAYCEKNGCSFYRERLILSIAIVCAFVVCFLILRSYSKLEEKFTYQVYTPEVSSDEYT